MIELIKGQKVHFDYYRFMRYIRKYKEELDNEQRTV